MESKNFPWKNLTDKLNSTKAKTELKEQLLVILQNFALFSIDPSEVQDVRIITYFTDSKAFFSDVKSNGM